MLQNKAGIAAAAERNKEPILAALQPLLAAAALPRPPRPDAARPLLLEVASGTGQHAAHFCAGLPHLDWQPTDPDPSALASIAGHREVASLDNFLAPLQLDVTVTDWPVRQASALFCANMIHIAPWEAAIGLAAGAGRLLPAGAPAILYGPYRRGGAHTADSNAAFDESLKARDPRWGVRDMEAVAALFAAAGFAAPEMLEMPANNLLLCFRKGAPR